MSDGDEKSREATKPGKAKMQAVGGSAISDDWNTLIVRQVLQGQWVKGLDVETCSKRQDATMLALVEISPRDVMEGMLVAQMVATHQAAMECFRRAAHPEQSADGMAECLRQAGKLSRAYVNLMEALLSKRQGKGRQVVRVERVTINGGQAIVGVVGDGAGVPGAREKNQEPSHAQRSADASVPALPCPDPCRDGMPMPSFEGQPPLPNAWREAEGRPEGQPACPEARALHGRGDHEAAPGLGADRRRSEASGGDGGRRGVRHELEGASS
jgi:hypothetical protein